VIHNAREHNLKQTSTSRSRARSSPSSPASRARASRRSPSTSLFNEGQRRYLESLNAYARQFVQPASRPDVDAIFGIPPTVAIEQRTSRGGRKSTVATLTEIYHFLRLLYVKLGTQHCPDCDVADRAAEPDAIVARSCATIAAARGLLAPLVVAARASTPTSPSGRRQGLRSCAWTASSLPGEALAAARPLQGAHIELPVATISRRRPRPSASCAQALATALEFGKGVVLRCSTAARTRAATSIVLSTRSAPARPAARASPSSTRGCSPSTRSTAGARLLRHRAQAAGLDEEQHRRGACVRPWTRARDASLRELRRRAPESRSRSTCASATARSRPDRANR
jgi:excinuclease ABC subunit A